MATDLEATRQLIYATARDYAAGNYNVREISMAKLKASQVAWDVADQCVQIHGGAGYMKRVPRRARDARHPAVPDRRGRRRDHARRHRLELRVLMVRFAGRLALVTGASRGIGEGIARRLAAEGAHVVVLARGLDAAEQVASEIGGEAVSVDIADAAAVHAAVAALGKLDVLVNNAGFDDFDYLTNTTSERWRRLLAVNLEGTFACTQAALPGMQAAGYGRILNIGSEAGRIGSKGNAVYAATKGGIIAFSKSIARENARYGITCNTLAVGPIETPLLDAARALPDVGEKMVQAMKDGTLLGRLGTTDEVAAAAAFLCAEESSFVTGETLGVSGGMGVGSS